MVGLAQCVLKLLLIPFILSVVCFFIFVVVLCSFGQALENYIENHTK